MGKSKAPAPPDYSALAVAQVQQANYAFQLGQEQLAWAKEQYAKDNQIYSKIVDGFMSDMAKNSESAAKDRTRYEELYQPLEDKMVKEANEYDTPERRQQAMGAAQSEVATQFDAQRENAQRELEAYGIDPSSTRYAALDIGVRTSQAAAQAAAGTMASNRVEDTGRALRQDAINIGKGYPSQIAQAYQTSSQQGQGAAGTTGQATNTGAATMGTGLQWNSQGMGGLSSAVNTLNTGYQNQLDRYKANQQSSGWGSALGLIGGIAGKAFGFAEGGAVPEGGPQDGGAVPDHMSPSDGAVVDDIPARLNAGEFVIPEDAVSWFGEKHFYGLLEKAQNDRQEAKQRTGAVPEEREAIPEAPVYQSA